MRRHLQIILILASLAACALALADTVSPESMTSAASAAAATAAPAEPGEILGTGLKVLNDWRTAGWMAGMVALCNALMFLIKRVPFVAALFKKGPPWLQPAVVVVVGAAGGFFSGLAAGGVSGALLGAVAGVGAGFSAVGVDTSANRASSSGAAEVAVVRAVKEALHGGDASAAAAKDAINEHLAAARKEPNEKKRMAALATLLNGARR